MFLRTSFCSSLVYFSSKRLDSVTHEILEQEKEKDHMWLKVNVVFTFILNVSLHSGGDTEEVVFQVSGEFLF